MLFFKKFILTLLLVPILSFSQVLDPQTGIITLPEGMEYVRGQIIEVDYTQPPQIILTVRNDTTGVQLKIGTTNYIRGQKEFYIQGDTLNIMPSPLHITNFWVTEEKIYIEVSEPVTIKLFNRNHKWKGTATPWGMQDLNHEDGYQSAQAFEFNKSWFTTFTRINITDPTPDDWDFALELHPIRTDIVSWSIWRHYKTFYFSMYEH